MIVHRRMYRNGVRSELPGTLADVVEQGQHRPETFVWIDLVEPTDEELAEVAAAYDLHPLAVEDALHAHQRPKLERFGDGTSIVVKTLRCEGPGDEVAVGEVQLLLGTSYVITVRHRSGALFDDLTARLESDRDQLARGPAAVVHAVVDQAVDGYSHVLEALEAELDALEEVVFSPGRGDHAARLYGLRREVQSARRAVDPLVDVADRLTRPRWLVGDPDLEAYFRDVHDHAIRARDRLLSVEVLADSALDAHLAQVGIQQNEDMRRISAWVAIAAAPTLIAGIYGMNFQDMPELRWEYGYPFALGIIATICIALYVGFRRNGWL
ncbi:MAG: magnesium/cobalt transporter CorA [Nitriliruptor sp.]|uniref:magnesium/cobalt transporter CorA n=1 Tax=Nitriliruptor sp. TaxID=2448056 RepID=UPI0034A0293F